MKIYFLVLFSLVICCQTNAQNFKKDTRGKVQKENPHNEYQVGKIDEADLLEALELSGINIFKIPLRPFNQKLHFSISLDEYDSGKLIRSKNISPTEDNIYYYFEKKDTVEKRFYDFFDQITFFSKDEDSVLKLKIDIYGRSISGIKLKKNKTRPNQFYSWRRYSKNEWEVNKSIPLLLYGSSWYDKNIDADRFCGVDDLSENEKETKELLKFSPHYFIISYKISK